MSKRSGKGDIGSPNKNWGQVLSFGLRKSSEAEILSSCKKILDLFRVQGLLTYRRVHVMPIKVNKYRDRPNEDMAGMEDLQIYMMHGKIWFVELKTEEGIQSPAQIIREKELKALGHDYSLIRSVDSFMAGLRQRGLSIWSMPG